MKLHVVCDGNYRDISDKHYNRLKELGHLEGCHLIRCFSGNNGFMMYVLTYSGTNRWNVVKKKAFLVAPPHGDIQEFEMTGVYLKD